MSGIRSKNTKPELAARRYLHAAGFRYRLHVKGLPGKPDIVLPKYGAVVNVHGCFWHRHQGCRNCSTPATRSAFWELKFRNTIDRDKQVTQQLLELGWRVLIVWECGLRAQPAATLEHLIHTIKNLDIPYEEIPCANNGDNRP